jgi:ATP-dependent exoDNAse (exonuclease V) beta subunit
VFIPNCNQDYWFGKGRVDKLGLPDNIVLTKDQENEDDYLRLLFVAITRAKDQLYLTRYTTTEDGKTLEPIGYLETSLQTLNIQPRQPLDNNEITNSANLPA